MSVAGISSSGAITGTAINIKTGTITVDTSNRNVGINTTSPSAQLEVNGNILTKSSVTINNSPYFYNIGKVMGASENGMWMNMANDTNGAIQGENQGVRWNNICLNPYGGSVGIGKINPAYTLDVNGTLNAGAITGTSANVGGGTVTCGIVNSKYVVQTFPITNTNAVAGNIFLGTFTVPTTEGHAVNVKVYSHIGFGAANNQDYIVDINFKNSNGVNLNGSGFNGNGYHILYDSAFNPNLCSYGSNVIYWVGNVAGGSARSYSLYMYQGAYNTNSFYTVTFSNPCSWSNATQIASPATPSNTSTCLLSTLISPLSSYSPLSGFTFGTGNLTAVRVTGQYYGSNTGGYRYISSTTNSIYTTATTSKPVGIFADNAIQTVMGLLVFSDNRIKHNIEYLSPEASLELIQRISPVSFNYIDPTKTTTKKYGYIAQEVESVLPTVINHSSEYIPNIFEIVQKDKTNKTKIRLTSKTTDLLELPKDKTQQIKLKFYDASNNEILREIQEIIDDKTILLSKPITEDPIFLYGQEVPDFRSVEHEQINAVLLSAVQAQQKKIEALESKNVSLEKKIESLESKIDFLLSKIQ